MDRRRRVRLGAQRDDAAHAPVVRRSPDGFGRRLHHHTLSLGLPAWHLPRPRTASSAAVATRRVTSPGHVASSLDASALCPARPLPTRPGPGRQPSAAGSPSPAPGFRSHGRSCSVWLPLSETSCSPPVGRWSGAAGFLPSFPRPMAPRCTHSPPLLHPSTRRRPLRLLPVDGAAVNVGVVGLSPRRWSHSLQIHTQGGLPGSDGGPPCRSQRKRPTVPQPGSVTETPLPHRLPCPFSSL